MTEMSVRPAMERPRAEVSGWVAATSISFMAVATVLMFTNDRLALSIERQLPTGLVILELSATLLVVTASWVASRQRPRVSVALALTGLAILIPSWSTWPSLPAGARAAVLAIAPLSVPGAGQVATGWHPDRGWSSRLRIAYGLAAAGGVTHLLAYNPFADPGCLRTCVDIKPLAAGIIDTPSAVAVTALLTIAAAWVSALAIARATPSPGPTVIIIGVIATLAVLATASGLRWVGSGDPRQSELVLLLPFVAGALVSLAVLTAVMQTWRTRRSIERLVARLAGGEGVLKDLGGTVREVQFAAPDGQGWIDSMGRPLLASEAEDDQIMVSDRTGAVVRLLLSPGKETIDVMEALTPATRLALKNAQLAAATRTRLTEVQASQRRVVATSDAERRRIERDLHDGAQQRLISAAFQMKLARTRLSKDPAALARAQLLVGDALGHLRQLAHGVFPSVLTSEGLWVALDELVRASVIPATLQLSGSDSDIDSETAMAAFATAVAVLKRAARENLTGQVSVSGRREGGVLELSVELYLEGDPPTLADLVDVGAVRTLVLPGNSWSASGRSSRCARRCSRNST